MIELELLPIMAHSAVQPGERICWKTRALSFCRAVWVLARFPSSLHHFSQISLPAPPRCPPGKNMQTHQRGRCNHSTSTLAENVYKFWCNGLFSKILKLHLFAQRAEFVAW